MFTMEGVNGTHELNAFHDVETQILEGPEAVDRAFQLLQSIEEKQNVSVCLQSHKKTTVYFGCSSGISECLSPDQFPKVYKYSSEGKHQQVCLSI